MLQVVIQISLAFFLVGSATFPLPEARIAPNITFDLVPLKLGQVSSPLG